MQEKSLKHQTRINEDFYRRRVARNLRILRPTDITQEQMAELCGITKKQYENAEKGTLTIWILEKIIAHHHTSFDKLFHEDF